MIPIFLSLFLANVLIIPEGSTTAQSAQQAAGTQTASAVETSSEVTQDEGIGTVVELKGKAMATSSNSARRQLAEGDPVYAGETLATSAGATLQIELKDESLFTISENTSIKMDNFVYDESAHNGNLAASVTKGIFRFVSGKIEKINPEKVNIDTPSGTIGIRGTIVVGEITGDKCLVALEPEEGDKVQHRIVVFNNAGGQRNEVEITKPGFATQIEGRNKPPQPIFQTPAAHREMFQQKLPKAPQFNASAKPGDPKRYENLFDTNRMKQQMENRKGEMAKREGGQNNPGNKSDDQNKKPGGPNGPNGPQGRDMGNNSEGANGNSGSFLNPKKEGGIDRPENTNSPLQRFQNNSNNPMPQNQNAEMKRPMMEGGNFQKPMMQQPSQGQTTQMMQNRPIQQPQNFQGAQPQQQRPQGQQPPQRAAANAPLNRPGGGGGPGRRQ